jgi:hypothetical protein
LEELENPHGGMAYNNLEISGFFLNEDKRKTGCALANAGVLLSKRR